MEETKRWEILSDRMPQSKGDLLEILLKNRGLEEERDQELFLYPVHPSKISLKEINLKKKDLEKAIALVKKGIDEDATFLIYGDYDADGVCATAILWEYLYRKTKRVIPYIPNRFSDGYGLKPESIERLKKEHPDIGYLITVDNGIVAFEGVEKAKELGLTVILTDHHQKGDEIPEADTIIHTDIICGSGVAWFFVRELERVFRDKQCKQETMNGLDLLTIGTIADQMTLLGVNRSIAYHGIKALQETKRVGFLALCEEAAIKQKELGTYEINYILVPRINASGRIDHGLTSLRLLCTRSPLRARELAAELGTTNRERQQILEEMILDADAMCQKRTTTGAIVLSGDTYHEGVIGLVASRLTEKYYLPTIVIAKEGHSAKASARSIPGFNIIEHIRKLDHLILGGGGHPMAAGFSIESEKIEEFMAEMETLSLLTLTKDMTTRIVKADCEIPFMLLSKDVYEELLLLSPFGLGNQQPSFVIKNVRPMNIKRLGQEGKHLKFQIEEGNDRLDSIAFQKGDFYTHISNATSIDILFCLDTNTWNNKTTIQLRVKDIHIRE